MASLSPASKVPSKIGLLSMRSANVDTEGDSQPSSLCIWAYELLQMSVDSASSGINTADCRSKR